MILYIITISLSPLYSQEPQNITSQESQNITQSQSGDDMASPENVMFYHSTDIYPEDDPTIRYVRSDAIRYFQPADGSMSNGMYHNIEKIAHTKLHDYQDVIEINGTEQQPAMNQKNQYTTQDGKLLDLIGIFDEYSENNGEKNIYYLFGTIKTVKDKNEVNNQPLFGYSTFPTQ